MNFVVHKVDSSMEVFDRSNIYHSGSWCSCYLPCQVHPSLSTHQGELLQFSTYYEVHHLEGIDSGEEESELTLAIVHGFFSKKCPWCWFLFGLKVLKGDQRGSKIALIWVWRRSGCYRRGGGTEGTSYGEENREEGDPTIWRCYWGPGRGRDLHCLK